MAYVKKTPQINQSVVDYTTDQENRIADEFVVVDNKFVAVNNLYQFPLALLNGWVANSTFGTVQSETRSGIVILSGLISGGESGSVIAILPNSQRPTSTLRFGCASAAGFTLVDIKPNGEIVHIGGGIINLSLSNIAYIKR